MKQVTFQLEELTCPSCVKKIETALQRLKGTLETKVLFHSSKVKVTMDESIIHADEIEKTITGLGYRILG